jgi:predicted transcriptional regulator
MESHTVRINKPTHEMVRELAKRTRTTMSAIIEASVREYKKIKFWEEYYAAYEALRANPEAWAEYEEEMRLWDSTLLDGLEGWPHEQDEG